MRPWATASTILCALTMQCVSPLAWPEEARSIEYPRGGVVAFVLDAAKDELVVVDLTADSGRVLAKVPVRLDPIASSGPSAVVVDRSRSALFVALAPPIPPHPPGPHSTHVLVPQDGTLVSLSLDTLRERARARTEPYSSALVLSDDRSSLWVASFEFLRALDARVPVEMRGGAVTVFDADTLAPLASGRPCLVPAAIAEGATADRAWIACFGEDAVASVERQGRSIARVRASAVGENPGRYPAIRFAPEHIALDAARGRVWLANHDSRELVSLSIADGTIAARVPLGAKPSRPLVDGPTTFVATREPGALVRVSDDTIAGRLVFDENVCVEPRSVARADGGRLFVLCAGDERRAGALVEVSPDGAALLRRFDVGQRPAAVTLYSP